MAEKSRPYHHGDLRMSLIDAAEAILAERGVEALTLRAAARRAGVSPAAPAHHFGSLAGLLTEVAILGFDALTAELEAGNARGGDDPAARLREQGVGYVRCALAHPGRFLLMFRRDRLRVEDPRLKAASGAAFATLAEGVRAVTGGAAEAPLQGHTLALLLLAWSSVHGFAHLALDGELSLFQSASGLEPFVATVLPQMLALLPAATEPGAST